MRVECRRRAFGENGERTREVTFRENERLRGVRRDGVRASAGGEGQGASGNRDQASELDQQALCGLDGAPGSGILFGVKRVAGSLAALVIIGLIPTVPAVGGSTAAKPRLRLVDKSPARVAGMGFRGRERVKLIFTSAGVWQKTLRATRAGTFTAVFPDATIDRCLGSVVIARGQRGSFATLKTMPFACPPPGRTP